MDVFDEAAESRRQITKQDLLQTLHVDQKIASEDEDIITDTLCLTEREIRCLQSSQNSIFWLFRRKCSFVIVCSIAHQYRSLAV